MDHAGLVRGLEALADLDGERNDLAFGQQPVGQLLRQRRTLDQLHHHEVDAVLAGEVVDDGDVRVPGARQHAGFALEPPAHRLVGQRAFGEDLERHVAVQVLVVGAIDDAHGACADVLENAVMRETPADHFHAGPRAAASRLRCAGAVIRLAAAPG